MNSVNQTTSFQRSLFRTISGALLFAGACQHSSGALLPLLCYLLALATLFHLIYSFGPLSKGQKMGLWLVLCTATPAFITTLWLSGKLVSLF